MSEAGDGMTASTRAVSSGLGGSIVAGLRLMADGEIQAHTEMLYLPHALDRMKVNAGESGPMVSWHVFRCG